MSVIPAKSKSSPRRPASNGEVSSAEALELDVSPQSLLATILGDYSWQLVQEPLPSALFVKLLGAFGIEAPVARVAIDRVCKRGLLDRTREGRLALYRYSKAAAELRLRRVLPLMRFGEDIEPWDGTWTMLLTSVPETRKELRARLRTQMAALGFVHYYDAVWVKPNHSSIPLAQAAIAELGIDQGAVFSTRFHGGSGPAADPLQSYDIAAVQTHYQAFLTRFAPLCKTPYRRLEGPEPLVLRTRLMDAWRTTIKLDPMLPAELLPQDFGRAKARQVFLAAYDALGPGAQAVVRDMARDCGLPAGTPLRHFTSREVLQHQPTEALAQP